MVELQTKGKKTTFSDLEDGQLAVILDDAMDYKGRVVMRHGGYIITVGMHRDHRWGTNANLEVRILEDGEIIKVTDNRLFSNS